MLSLAPEVLIPARRGRALLLEMVRRMHSRALLVAALSTACVIGAGASALADRIRHPTAVFAGLDKITGRIIAFEAAIDETVQFGSLQITPRVCYTRPPTEAPMTTGFVEVDEASGADRFKRIFGGWMYAASPGLHGIEHPVYDAWLTDCKGGKEVIPDAVARSEPAPAPAPQPAGRQPRGRDQQPQSQQPASASAPAGAARAPAAGQPLPPLPSASVPAAPGQRSPLPAPPAPAARAPDPLPPADPGVFGGPPRPPANVGRQQATEPRRAPSQSYFPSPF
jgi:hypothetical protein